MAVHSKTPTPEYKTKSPGTGKAPGSKATNAPKKTVREQSRGKSLEKLKEMLLLRRDSLRRFLSEEDDRPSMFDNVDLQVGDTVDAALEATECEMEYHFVEAESREFGQIERAIQRFEQGDYGICETCGCAIPIARLKVLPFAGKCVKCQQLDEDEQNSSSFKGWRTYDYAVSSSLGEGVSRGDRDYEL